VVLARTKNKTENRKPKTENEKSSHTTEKVTDETDENRVVRIATRESVSVGE
jgi:hypothetical protein